MKSAWEIAMEKAEKLGKPSPEELAKRREESSVPIGEALARKYLAGLTARDLQIELDKYKGEDRNIVIRSLLNSLKASISLDSPDPANRVLEAWGLLSPSPQKEPVWAAIRELIESYARARTETRAKAGPRAEDELRRELAAEGIAGTAVVINPEQTRATQAPEVAGRDDYAARLETLKDELG
ncbi:MAG: hypothetical protein HYY29_05455 [Chloroflexi bacterium]|nr:hypothetical protein [Chloroflexota bacterium]